MELHPRRPLVTKARGALSTALTEWMEKHPDLTFGEELMIVQGELTGHIGHLAKYEIRRERHSDDQEPGGVALIDEDQDQS